MIEFFKKSLVAKILAGVLGFSILSIAGLEIGFATSSYLPSGLKINGNIVLLKRNEAKDFLQKNVDDFLNLKVTLKSSDKKFSYNWKTLGANTDFSQTLNELKSLGSSWNPFNDFYVRYLCYKGKINYTINFSLDEDKAKHILKTLAPQIEKKPQDAVVDLDARVIHPDIKGEKLNINSTLKNIRSALKNKDSSVLIAVDITRAKLTKEDLKDLDITNVISSFETYYGFSSVARVHNLKLAAKKLNGTIIKPGQTISYNEIVGERTITAGFKMAPVIIKGKVVQDWGGGACQISSTLHAASLFAGLKIVQRTPHSIPSHYIKMGLDAAVVYPYLDLKIKNNFPFPIAIHYVFTKDKKVRVEILGKKKLYKVDFQRAILGTFAAAKKQIPDPTLPEGKKVVEEKGNTGYKVARKIIITSLETGKTKTLSTVDIYPPHKSVVRIGTKKVIPPATTTVTNNKTNASGNNDKNKKNKLPVTIEDKVNQNNNKPQTEKTNTENNNDKPLENNSNKSNNVF